MEMAPPQELHAERAMRPADVWSAMFAEKEEQFFHPVCKYPSVVLSEQFSIATYHQSAGGFLAGGMAVPKAHMAGGGYGCYYEVQVLEVDDRWASGLGIGFTTKKPDDIVAMFGSAAKFPRTAKGLPGTWLLGYDGSLVIVDKRSKWISPKEVIGPPWSPKSLKRQDRIGVLAHKTGFSLWVNGTPKICFTGEQIQTNVPLYALMELDGRTKSVRMIAKPTSPDVSLLQAHLAKVK